MRTAFNEQQSHPRRAMVFQQDVLAGRIAQLENGEWRFVYEPGYTGPPVSLSLTSLQPFLHFWMACYQKAHSWNPCSDSSKLTGGIATGS